MLKGAKKAIVRAPHRFAGSKSIEDRIIIEWTKDFNTAETALDLLISETKRFKATWKDICETQVAMGQRFAELYNPIVEDNVYSLTQETPESQMRAIQGYLAVIQEVEATLVPMLEEFEGPFIAKCKGAKECIDSVQKILKKRERKKMDFDRASNNVEKMFKKSDASEKDQQALTVAESQLEAATEVFHALDERVKSTVPFVLTAMSSFLNPLTSQLYLNQLKVYKVWNQILFKYSQTQGLTGGLTLANIGKVDSEWQAATYTDVVENWEDRFLTIQPRAEQGIKILREGKTISKPLHPQESRQNAVEKLAHKSADKTSELAHKAVGKPSSATVIKFSSPQGFFQTEADLLAHIARSSAPASPSLASPAMTPTVRSPVVGSGGFSATPMSRSVSLNQSLAQRSVIPASPTTVGRSPVTSVFPGPPADTEVLRTRVRASMSTAARTLTPPSSADYYRDSEDDAPSDSEEPRRTSGDFISSTLRRQEQVLRRRSTGSANGSTAASTRGQGHPHGPQRIPAGENEHAVAVYTFPGTEPGDVAFRVGDRVKVLDHGDETDTEWWFGQTADGRLGLFPRTYVEVE